MPALSVLCLLILVTILEIGHDHPHFTYRKTEAQRSVVIQLQVGDEGETWFLTYSEPRVLSTAPKTNPRGLICD